MISKPNYRSVGLASAGLCLVLVALAIAKPAMAFGDPDRGRQIAERWCSSCHVVTATGPDGATDGAPTFRSIATDPQYTRSRVFNFLKAPHPPMPDFQLSNQTIDDLVAYFESMGLR